MISIIDYGVGNLGSVLKAFELYTSDVRIISNPKDFNKDDALILPGDGAFAHAMGQLKETGWDKIIKEHVAKNRYFLGICLGYQLLFKSSSEFGQSKGLGLVDGEVVRFNSHELKIPHMGWNQIKIKQNHKFLENIPDDSYFYFIHTFYPVLNDDSWLVASAEYGVTFPCMVGKGNVLATQFHPEKSHNVGLKIIQSFVEKYQTVC